MRRRKLIDASLDLLKKFVRGGDLVHRQLGSGERRSEHGRGKRPRPRSANLRVSSSAFISLFRSDLQNVVEVKGLRCAR